MPLWSRLKSLARSLRPKPSVESDLDEELQSYTETIMEEKIAAGMSAAEARRTTLADIGGIEQVKQSVRDRRTGTGLESLLQDLRYGLRQMRKSPGFGITVIVTLALSIGITAAVFSVLYAMLIRPLPYHHPDSIVALDTRSASGGSQAASYPEYVDWRRMTHSFSELAGYTNFGTIGLETTAGPVALHVVEGTDNFFDVFGVHPITGRTYLPGEDVDGKNNIVVLSYETWQQDFGGQPVIGRSIHLDGLPHTIIGVMPAGFRFPINAVNAVYRPLHLSHEQRNDRGNHWLQTVARLKPGIGPHQAEADLTTVFTNLGRTDAFDAGRTVKAVDLASYIVGSTNSSLRLLLYAVLAMLVIGCVNIAGLMLARGIKREREMALRSAIGASRSRIARQILTESILLAVCGAAGGIVLAYALLHVIRLLLVSALSRGSEVELNLPILLIALLVSAAVTIIAALMPALRLSATAPTLALKSGGSAGATRGQHRLRTTFVVTQVALALALIVVSGLLMHMLASLRNTDLGFSPANILTTEVNLPYGRYTGQDVSADFYQPLFDRVHALPGVQAVGMIQMLPVQSWGWNGEHIHIFGTAPLQNPRTAAAEIRFVSPGYYQVFQDRLLAGRLQDPSLDKPSTRLVAVVNEAFVKQFIPAGRDPLGVEIGDNTQTDTRADQQNPRLLIVGVVKNIRQSIYQPAMPQMDFLVTQVPAKESLNVIGSMHLVLRTSGAPESLVPSLRRAFHDIDPAVPFRTAETMQTVVADVLTFERLENWLFGAFASLAMLLAIVGLYGLLSHEVELSTRDIGVRLALGATRGTILSDIYRRVAWMLGVGVCIGLLLTAAAQRYINSVVSMQAERDGTRILILAATLVFAGLLAALLPAHRAASVEPMAALREE
jgi:predicted permease